MALNVWNSLPNWVLLIQLTLLQTVLIDSGMTNLLLYMILKQKFKEMETEVGNRN